MLEDTRTEQTGRIHERGGSCVSHFGAAAALGGGRCGTDAASGRRCTKLREESSDLTLQNKLGAVQR